MSWPSGLFRRASTSSLLRLARVLCSSLPCYPSLAKEKVSPPVDFSAQARNPRAEARLPVRSFSWASRPTLRTVTPGAAIAAPSTNIRRSEMARHAIHRRIVLLVALNAKTHRVIHFALGHRLRVHVAVACGAIHARANVRRVIELHMRGRLESVNALPRNVLAARADRPPSS